MEDVSYIVRWHAHRHGVDILWFNVTKERFEHRSWTWTAWKDGGYAFTRQAFPANLNNADPTIEI